MPIYITRNVTQNRPRSAILGLTALGPIDLNVTTPYRPEIKGTSKPTLIAIPTQLTKRKLTASKIRPSSRPSEKRMASLLKTKPPTVLEVA